ncbi:MAG: hypothetical protein IJ609_01095 [Paludibacteraceae bacterium]|nr:hypothetical protein [Paludibacteraceae bacterium]MBR1480516.1 hypothetical protein [Paludibacteraceae bacterium]
MKKTSVIQSWLSGEVFRRDIVRKQYKLIGLIVVLVFIYIFAGYNSAKQQHRLSDARAELKDLRFRYLTLSTEQMRQTRQSQIAEQLREQGSRLRENTTPVTEIR